MSGAESIPAGPPSAGTAPVAISSAPIITPIKIRSLTVRDFRAFAGPEAVTIALNSKNLLVYGENGAGKSSIFHALDELFSTAQPNALARKERLKTLKNIFSNGPEDDVFVEVQMDDGAAPARWSNNGHPVDTAPAKADARIVNGAYRKAILDYRALLDTNYRHGLGEINLFDISVRVLLRDYPAVHLGQQIRLYDLWTNLTGYLKRKQLRKTQIAEIDALALSFNTALREAIDYLLPLINSLLKELGWEDVTVRALQTPGITYNKATWRAGRDYDGKTLNPRIDFRGASLQRPQSFLNEARLSALALAIYFAGRQVCAATLQTDTPRLMVLDDVLIGLDQSNRLPVLQVLDKHFPDWQVVLLTHDFVWFEMARFHLADRDDWASVEMFEEKQPDGTPMPIVGPVKPLVKPISTDQIAANIATGRKFYVAHEYPASAVHARVAFELSLKKVCERKGIPVRFQTDPRKLTTDDLLKAIETWLGDASRVAMKAAVDPAIASLRMWRKVVLNPFSHSTPVSLTAGEVIGAIDAVEALHKAFRDHIK